jgi:hypothetical protein
MFVLIGCWKKMNFKYFNGGMDKIGGGRHSGGVTSPHGKVDVKEGVGVVGKDAVLVHVVSNVIMTVEAEGVFSILS